MDHEMFWQLGGVTRHRSVPFAGERLQGLQGTRWVSATLTVKHQLWQPACPAQAPGSTARDRGTQSDHMHRDILGL